MPIYTYKCKECDEVLDKIHSYMVKGVVMVCPKCGGDMKLIPSPTGYRRDHTVSG